MSANESIKPPVKRSRGRPRLEDVEDIENILLKVALQEFLQHGYGGASVSRIVRNARMSKTTVYSRFSSKEALFHAIMEKQIEQLAPERILAPDGDKLNLEAGLKAYANRMLEFSLKKELVGVNRLMYSEAHRFPELAREAERRSRLGIKRISEYIAACAEADGIACNDPESVAEVFIQMIRGWYIDVVLSDRPVTLKQCSNWVDRSVHVLLAARQQW